MDGELARAWGVGQTMCAACSQQRPEQGGQGVQSAQGLGFGLIHILKTGRQASQVGHTLSPVPDLTARAAAVHQVRAEGCTHSCKHGGGRPASGQQLFAPSGLARHHRQNELREQRSCPALAHSSRFAHTDMHALHSPAGVPQVAAPPNIASHLTPAAYASNPASHPAYLPLIQTASHPAYLRFASSS